jgi:hypothetical protein
MSILPVSLRGQAVVSGLVSDADGLPVELAAVHVEGTPLATTTDLQGRYSLTLLGGVQDSVVIVFAQIGYMTRKRTLRRPAGNITLNVMLPSEDILLNVVEVKGQKPQTTFTDKIDVKAGRYAPDATGGSIEAILATQAGVSSTNELSTGYNVRGGSFDENMVYVNGVEVYRPLLIRAGEQEGLSFVNPDMVDEVRFSTGGFEARYGDKMSSVLDIRYKKPTRMEAAAALSLLGASGYVGIGTKQLTWTHGLRYKTSRYLLGSLDTKGEYDPAFLDYQTYLSYRPSKRWEVSLIGNVSQNRYDFAPENRTTRFGTVSEMKEFTVYFDGQERDVFRTLFGSAALTYTPDERNSLTVQLGGFHTREQETYDLTGQYWLSESTGGEAGGTFAVAQGVGTYMEHARNRLTAEVLSYALRGRHRLSKGEIEWGMELRKERIKDHIREWELRDSAGYSLPHTGEAVNLIYNLASRNELSSTRTAFFVQDTHRWRREVGMFTLTAGLRAGYWNYNKEFLLSPRVSLGLIPVFDDRYTFRLAVGVYHQAPFYKEFRDTLTVGGATTVQLNEEIKSPRAIHFVAGGDYRFRAMGRNFRFTTEAYYKALSRLVPYNIDNVRIRYYGSNQSHGYAAGLDMRLFGEFVAGHDSWLSFSLMQTEERLNGKWIPRPTDQRYNVSLYFTDYLPQSDRWTMNLKCAFAGGLPFGAPHSGLEAQVFRAPTYKRVDIGISRRTDLPFVRDCRIGLDVLNLLDNSNVNSYYWITDVSNAQYAVPNYLTGRRLNLRLLLEW